MFFLGVLTFSTKVAKSVLSEKATATSEQTTGTYTLKQGK